MEAIIWLVALIVFLIAEASTVTMVSLWFAVGSLVAMITALLGGPIWLQIVLCLVVSAALLACLRPWVKKFINPAKTRTNVDSVIGSQGYVTADIDNLAAIGQVKLGGMEWTARSSGGEKISAGTLVQVDRIEGVKAFVTPVKITANT